MQHTLRVAAKLAVTDNVIIFTKRELMPSLKSTVRPCKYMDVVQMDTNMPNLASAGCSNRVKGGLVEAFGPLHELFRTLTTANVSLCNTNAVRK